MGRTAKQVLAFLYVGGQDAAADPQFFADARITHVVNITRSVKVDVRVGIVETHRIDVSPDPEQDKQVTIRNYFDEANRFIEAARKRKGNVLVFCNSPSSSWAGAIVMAYLQMHRLLDYKNALRLVAAGKPQVRPIVSFLTQLRTYDNSECAKSRAQLMEVEQAGEDGKVGRKTNPVYRDKEGKLTCKAMFPLSAAVNSPIVCFHAETDMGVAEKWAISWQQYEDDADQKPVQMPAPKKPKVSATVAAASAMLQPAAQPGATLSMPAAPSKAQSVLDAEKLAKQNFDEAHRKWSEAVDGPMKNALWADREEKWRLFQEAERATANAGPGGPMCCSCKKEKPDYEYSKSQLRKPPGEQKCTECITGKPVEPPPGVKPPEVKPGGIVNDGSFLQKFAQVGGVKRKSVLGGVCTCAQQGKRICDCNN